MGNIYFLLVLPVVAGAVIEGFEKEGSKLSYLLVIVISYFLNFLNIDAIIDVHL